MDIKITKLPQGEVEIVGKLPSEEVESEKKNAIKEIQKDLEMPGFRKGHVPENIVLSRYGELGIFEEAARVTLDKKYAGMISENNLKVIGRPKVTFTKLAINSPVEFKIVVPVLPEFSLPDYKKIAKETVREESKEPTEKEVEDVVLEIRKRKAHADIHAKGEKHDHSKELAEKDLPALDDQFVKGVGDFKDVADFKNKIKENLTAEKKLQVEEKWRTDLFDKLVEKTEIEIPEVLTLNELEKTIAQFKDEVAGAGISFEDYLAQIKKTEDDLRTEWKPGAEKKAKLQLILNKISEKEKIEPDKEKIQNETTKLLTIYQDSDPVRARLYVAQMMLNQEVIKFLDGINSPTKEKAE